MSRKLSRSDALEDISSWSTNDVLWLLRKYGLEECCKAASKRQIDGDELLHLTEGKLALWKSDLTRPLIRSLWTFVEDVKRCPERYAEERNAESHQSDEHMSDNSSWGTDFEDEIVDESADFSATRNATDRSPESRNHYRGSPDAVEDARTRSRLDDGTRNEVESTYANCDSAENANVYANLHEPKGVERAPARNASKLHGQNEDNIVDRLKNELDLRNAKKPAVGPKPDSLVVKRSDLKNGHRTEPQKSFLHDASKPRRSFTEPPQRSPDKKSATLPHASSNSSLSNDRATRPLPPPPDRQSYTDKPWFHNVTREQATTLIKEQISCGCPRDGHFLLRPSTTNVNNPLALVLWYKDRVYNVPVRKRPDNRYALGFAKANEQSFSSVEDIVTFYMREELVLYTGGVQTGSTKLTDTPSKGP